MFLNLCNLSECPHPVVLDRGLSRRHRVGAREFNHTRVTRGSCSWVASPSPGPHTLGATLVLLAPIWLQLMPPDASTHAISALAPEDHHSHRPPPVEAMIVLLPSRITLPYLSAGSFPSQCTKIISHQRNMATALRCSHRLQVCRGEGVGLR